MTPASAGLLYTTECSPFRIIFPGAETVNRIGILTKCVDKLKYVGVFFFFCIQNGILFCFVFLLVIGRNQFDYFDFIRFLVLLSTVRV